MVPLMAAIGFGMPVFTAAAADVAAAFGPGMLDKLVLLSERTSKFFGAATIFNLLSLFDDFCTFGGTILLSFDT